MDIATIRPMGLGPKFSWPFIYLFFLLLISLQFIIYFIYGYEILLSCLQTQLVRSRYLGHG